MGDRELMGRDVDLLVLWKPGKRGITGTSDGGAQKMTRGEGCTIVPVEVTTTTIGHLPARTAQKLEGMQPLLQQLKVALPACPIIPLVVAITTTGVMAKSATTTLEDLGMTGGRNPAVVHRVHERNPL